MYHLMYITHISIGSPPQLFLAVVDITQSNLFVPSWNCTSNSKNYEIEYCMPHLMYDGSRSSTHEDILESAQVHYYGMYGWGNLSRDTVCIAELCILGQDFQESTRWHPAYLIDWDEQYDSALGLSRFQSTNTYDDFNNTRILQALHEQKLLARNVFALKHPRTDEDTGELILGGSDRTFAGSLVKLPLIDLPMDSIDSNYIPYASAGWNVDASSIHMGAFAEKTALDIALPEYAAVMTNSYANIMFPGVINRQILSHFNLSQDHYGDYTFDCDKRHIFPNFTIALGPQKHEFVLEPWQYMHEVIDPNGQQRCTFPFKILYEDEEHPDYILLGAAFLASWYAEFDLDEGTVGREFSLQEDLRIRR